MEVGKVNVTIEVDFDKLKKLCDELQKAIIEVERIQKEIGKLKLEATIKGN